MRILDIGCGERAPLALLFAAEGARVDAIDLVPIRLGRRRPLMWAATLTSLGIRPCSRLIARDLIHTIRYWQRLERHVGRRLPTNEVRVRQMTAESLTFVDNSFDIVISSAVWEHLGNVRAATREVNRALRPGGTAIIQIALFASLEGGHHGEWHDTAPRPGRRIRPWDHLLPGRAPPPTFLNEWREAAYRRVFEEEVVVLRWDRSDQRGAEYLSDEVRSSLAMYSEQELLTPAVTIWATKRLGVRIGDDTESQGAAERDDATVR